LSQVTQGLDTSYLYKVKNQQMLIGQDQKSQPTLNLFNKCQNPVATTNRELFTSRSKQFVIKL